VSSEPPARHAATPSADKYPKASSWVGWIAFAAVCMVVLGGFHILQGAMAIVDADYFPVTGAGPVTDLSLDAWGWVHVVGGVILLVAGLCVFAGQTWARAVGVLVAVASAVANFGFLGAYPLWSLVMIALDIVIILAITVHGSEIKP
jgi:hypothetical protein